MAVVAPGAGVALTTIGAQALDQAPPVADPLFALVWHMQVDIRPRRWRMATRLAHR